MSSKKRKAVRFAGSVDEVETPEESSNKPTGPKDIPAVEQKVEDGEEEYTEQQVHSLSQKQSSFNEKKDAFPVIPFNLKADRETGYFDESGGYVWQRRKDDDEDKDASDAWLESVDESKVLHKPKRIKLSEGQSDAPPTSPNINMYKLYRLLKDDKETPLQALQRMGKKGEKDTLGIEKLSTAAGDLIETLPTIYEMPRAELRNKISAWLTEQMKLVKWEYKMTLQDKETHGPYTSAEMQQWKQQGYFSGEHSVFLKRVGAATGGTSQKDLKNDLMDDADSEDEETEEWVKSDSVDFEHIVLN